MITNLLQQFLIAAAKDALNRYVWKDQGKPVGSYQAFYARSFLLKARG